MKIMTTTKQRIKRNVRLIILLLLNLIIAGILVASLHISAEGAVYRWGSTGPTVREIQTRLKNWGYYTGNVDGIYGAKTYSAVRYFQSKHGLKVDGIAGPATLRLIGVSEGSASGISGYSDADYKLLAAVISAEARGEPYTGQVAVGAVILNRVKHPSFPNTISGVVYQPQAFTCMTDGQIKQPVADSAYRAAKDAMNGWDPSGGAIYYYAPSKTSNAWMLSRPVITTIGSHKFCK